MECREAIRAQRAQGTTMDSIIVDPTARSISLIRPIYPILAMKYTTVSMAMKTNRVIESMTNWIKLSSDWSFGIHRLTPKTMWMLKTSLMTSMRQHTTPTSSTDASYWTLDRVVQVQMIFS